MCAKVRFGSIRTIASRETFDSFHLSGKNRFHLHDISIAVAEYLLGVLTVPVSNPTL